MADVEKPISGAPYGVYVHYPRCLSKCPYCDFNSQPGDAPDGWADAALRQYAAERPLLTAVRPASIYFGGGTPSLANPNDLARLIEAARDGEPADALEITVEANPGALDPGRLRAFRQAGVNRLSIGAQSFDDAVLRFLGRRHTAAQARQAVEQARTAGFANVGLDLILATRATTEAAVEGDLDALRGLRPEHVSIYFLTIEGDTPFARRARAGEPLRADDAAARAQYQRSVDALRADGFERYEISNVARPGFRSRHNGLYWSGAEYLGLGPGASGFWFTSRPTRGVRRKTLADPDAWRRAVDAGMDWVAETDELDAAALTLERIMLGLRTVEGLDLNALRRDLGCDLLAEKADVVERLVQRGWLDLADGRLRLTDEGVFWADGATAELA